MPYNDVPPGFEPTAVLMVREAHGLKCFYMTQRLGITVSELTECENAARWPKSKNAREKLIAMANEKQVDIGQEKENKSEQEATLF